MRLAIVSASSSAIFRILLRPSRTTCTTWASFTVSRLQNGGITCFSIRCATWRRHRDALSITHRVKKGRALYSSMKMIKLKLILKAANIMKSFQFYVYRTYRLPISCTLFMCLGEAYLIFPPAYCQVTDGPGCFFLSAKVTLKHTFNVSNPSITQKLSESN